MSNSLEGSSFFDRYGEPNHSSSYDGPSDDPPKTDSLDDRQLPLRQSPRTGPQSNGVLPTSNPRNIHTPPTSSPLNHSTRLDSASPSTARTPMAHDHYPPGFPSRLSELPRRPSEDYTDERAREVITGRLIHGHIVDDNAPSPALSAISGSNTWSPHGGGNGLSSPAIEESDPMAMSFMSTVSRRTTDYITNSGGDNEEDEEEGFNDPELEHTVTLVGNVAGRCVFIIDDMIDQPGSWIAAAETVVKRGDAERVYCIATHGLFGDDSLEQMEACECIDFIVVTNTYPIAPERVERCRKLVVLDMAHLLSEAIRRNHYGESISALFQHYPD